MNELISISQGLIKERIPLRKFPFEVALISCGKAKAPSVSQACELYTSPGFTKMRQYAEKFAERYYILSGKHGVLEPLKRIAPYEAELSGFLKKEKLAWAEKVKGQLGQYLPKPVKIVVVAPKCYWENLLDYFKSCGHTVELPLEHSKQGERNQWLKERLLLD